MKNEDVPSAARRQDETRKIGNEARLKEKVVDATPDTKAHKAARNSRFASTKEPSKAPCYEDVE
jgi:hypothetical protein